MKFGIDRLLADPALLAQLNGRRVALVAREQGDATDPATLVGKIEDSYAIINLAGIMFEGGTPPFAAHGLLNPFVGSRDHVGEKEPHDVAPDDILCADSEIPSAGVEVEVVLAPDRGDAVARCGAGSFGFRPLLLYCQDVTNNSRSTC